MWYYNGEIIRTAKSIQIGDLRYNAELFQDATKLAEIGIKSYRIVKPDSRYFSLGAESLDTSGDEVVCTYAGNGKDTDILKSNMLKLIKRHLTSKLESTDWYYLRKLRTGTDVPVDVQKYSDALYAEYDTKKSEISAMNKISQIEEFDNRPHTSVTKVRHDGEDGKTAGGPETESATRHINMCTQWTSNPDDEIDPAFVSLTAD